MKGSGEDVRVTNKYIGEVSNSLFEIYTGMARDGKAIFADDIKIKYTRMNIPTVESKKLLEVFDINNTEVEALNWKDYVKATLTKYKTIRSKVADFIKSKYRKNDMFIEELDITFIAAFEKYLKITENIEHNTAMSYIKRVKLVPE